MKTWSPILLIVTYLFAGCGTSGSLNRTPQEDKEVFQSISKLVKSGNDDESAQKAFTSAYATAVLRHQSKITEYRNGSLPDRWERIMYEYGQLNKLAETVQASAVAAKLVQTKRYDEQFAEAKQRAVEDYYEKAKSLLRNDNRDASVHAYELLQRLNSLSPNYKDSRNLSAVAERNSLLNVVVAPVNYYAQSYNYWGLNNDYVQQEIVRELRFQLPSKNVRVFTDLEARANRINPDRIIEIRWDELFLPYPTTQSLSREVSRDVQTGVDADKKPVYTTVRATIYVTRRALQASGNLSCTIVGAGNQRLLWETFPASYNWVEESAMYRGDSRALSSYDWALINNSRVMDPNRRDVFVNVFRQVYPQLMSRIRSIQW
jgi:hypothetical protein